MTRAATAALLFAEAAILGYALHRLAFSFGEGDPRAMGASVHTPYYWRVATSLWWGALAAAAGWRWPGMGEWAWKAFWPAMGVAVGIAVFVP